MGSFFAPLPAFLTPMGYWPATHWKTVPRDARTTQFAVMFGAPFLATAFVKAMTRLLPQNRGPPGDSQSPRVRADGHDLPVFSLHHVGQNRLEQFIWQQIEGKYLFPEGRVRLHEGIN